MRHVLTSAQLEIVRDALGLFASRQEHESVDCNLLRALFTHENEVTVSNKDAPPTYETEDGGPRIITGIRPSILTALSALTIRLINYNRNDPSVVTIHPYSMWMGGRLGEYTGKLYLTGAWYIVVAKRAAERIRSQ